MLLSSQNIDIKEDPTFGSNCLHFSFKGKFTEEASILATQAWSTEFDSNPTTSYSFLWDCLKMDGFEIAARKEWYRCMKIYKDRISKVCVVSDSILIRGAARVMLQFFGIPSTIVKSFDDLLETT